MDLTKDGLTTPFPTITWIEQDSQESFIGVNDYMTTVELDSKLKKEEIERLKKPTIRKRKVNIKDFDKGDVVYSQEKGYINIVDFHQVQDTTDQWNISCIKERASGEPDLNMYTIPLSSCSNFITVQATIYLDGRLIKQKLRLSLKDKIEEILPVLCNCHNADFTVVWNNKEVKTDLRIYEIGIKDGDHMSIFGVKRIIGGRGFNSKIRYYNRYKILASAGWYVGKERWDALIIIPKRKVNILGIGIYLSEHNDTSDIKLGYKFKLRDSNGNVKEETAMIYEDVKPSTYEIQPDKFFYYHFQSYPKGIAMDANDELEYQQWEEGWDTSHYGKEGDVHKDIDNDEKDVFEFKVSHQGRYTDGYDRGIIPAIVYN